MARRTPQPPRLAEGAIRILLPGATREYVVGDLAEQYAQRAHRGRLRAHLWYWRQVLDSVSARRQTPARVVLPRRATSDLPRAAVMDSLRQDLRFAVRQLVRYPLFATTVVATLALGIGANTAIFSIVYGVVLRPLPYADAESLFALYAVPPTSPTREYVPDPDFAVLLEQADGIQVASIDETLVMPLSVGGDTEPVSLQRVHHNFFDILGVTPALGRVFRAEDGVPVPDDSWRPQVLVVSHAFWQGHMGGDPDVVGREVTLMGRKAWVVGVLPADFAAYLPPSFEVGADIQVWMSSRYDYAAQSREAVSRVVGRSLAGGLAGAQGELDAVAGRLAEDGAFVNDDGYRFQVVPLLTEVVGDVRSTLMLLLGAVGFVLLIACANVANLLMARGTARRSELAIRAALGAGRWRLVRQALTESFVLSGIGMIAGVAFAFAGIAGLKALGPDGLPRINNIGLDLQVLLFSLAIAGLATLAYGLLPALRLARAGDPSGAERTVTDDRASRRVQSGLAVAQVALSIVLISGAALMVRSVVQMQKAPVGFDPQNLVTFRTNIITACQVVDGQRTGCDGRFRDSIERAIRASLLELPGVTEVGAGFPLPMNGVYSRVAAYALPAHRDQQNRHAPLYFRTVNETFFDAMGIELRAGRGFRREDGEIVDGARRVVVDERLAAREWPGENPIGKQLALFEWGLDRDEPYEVIGVVEYVPQWDHWDQRPSVYVPRRYWPSIEVSFGLRMAQAAGPGFAEQLRDQLRSVHPDLPIEIVQMTELVGATMRSERFVLLLLSVFSVLATALASIGLYGVLSYSVRQRFREIGIRLALGARRQDVARQVVGSGMRLASVGLVAGVGLALLLGGLLRQQLYQIAPGDPLALGGTVLVVAAVALVACTLPARRAAAADPATVLRQD
jgi:predicted permease